MRKFDRAVVAEFAWRNDTSAGLRLLWDRTLEQDDEDGESDDDTEVDSEEQQDA